MFVKRLVQHLGNETAIDNARLASTELSQRRVEREAVEIYLESLDARPGRRVGAVEAAASGR